jgi:stalled ribosome alternative rescue factor ArfA
MKKKAEIRNKLLHAVRTPMFRSRVEKDKKKESKKTGSYLTPLTSTLIQCSS